MKNGQSTRKTSNRRKATATKDDSVLSHYWHPVAWSRDLGDKPLPVRLLDLRCALALGERRRGFS